MKLSMSDSVLMKHIAEGLTDRKGAFEAIRACGFTELNMEVCVDWLGEGLREHAENTRALLAETGLNASLAHAPGINFRTMALEKATEIYSASLRYCKIVGIPMAVMHPGAIDGDDRETFFRGNVEMYRSLIPAAEETGVKVLIENIGNYADPYYLWNGKDLREMIDAVNHPLFGACWDTGHANHFFPEHCDQYESIMALGDKLWATHIHDNAGYFEDPRKHHRIDMHMHPYGCPKSSVNFDAVLQGLIDAGYQGTFNFECAAPASAYMRAPFVYKGETVRKLEMPSMKVWIAYNTALYECGKFMLETYGLME